MKFRKKPIVIEAVQYEARTFDGVCDGCSTHRAPEVDPHIHTLEGVMIVSPGDWIITGVQGERYPCKPDIFEATYEAVDQ